MQLVGIDNIDDFKTYTYKTEANQQHTAHCRYPSERTQLLLPICEGDGKLLHSVQ